MFAVHSPRVKKCQVDFFACQHVDLENRLSTRRSSKPLLKVENIRCEPPGIQFQWLTEQVCLQVHTGFLQWMLWWCHRICLPRSTPFHPSRFSLAYSAGSRMRAFWWSSLLWIYLGGSGTRIIFKLLEDTLWTFSDLLLKGSVSASRLLTLMAWLLNSVWGLLNAFKG